MRPPVYEPTSPPSDTGEYTVVVYDGECGLCRRWVSRLEAWDREGRLELLPFQDESVSQRFPWIPAAAFREAVQVVAPDGRTWSGAGAAEYLTGVLPGGRSVGWLFRLPGARAVADRIYRWVADRRGRDACDRHCS